MLAALGFSVRPFGGGVVWMTSGRDASMTRQLTPFDLAEGQFIADMGFGGQTPTAPPASVWRYTAAEYGRARSLAAVSLAAVSLAAVANLLSLRMDIDLAAYFTRIGYTGAGEPNLATLRALHALHPTRIAFEGLDPFLGRPVEIDTASIQAKLVHGRRGGYCHEHNALFHDVLAALGFCVRPLGGRVIWITPGRDAPMTHQLTLVDIAEGRFIADVGFGGQTPTAPLRLEPGLEQATSHGSYRLVRDWEVYETQMRLGNRGEARWEPRWEPMYRFTLEARPQVDFEVANWFTSTHPRGRFTNNLVVARVVDDTRVNLFNTSVTIHGPEGVVEQRTLANADELRHMLEHTMELTLPAPAATIWARLPSSPSP